MKKLINVTYSVQYEKVLELEINEENLEDLERIGVVKYDTDSNCYEDMFNYNQDVLSELPIPDTNDLENDLQAEYVDNSFDIVSFELA